MCGSSQPCSPDNCLHSAVLRHQSLLSPLSWSICSQYTVWADKQQLAVVFGGRQAWSVAWSLETLYWAYAEVSNTFQCPLSAGNCQVTVTRENGKLKMWNVGVTGKKSTWRKLEFHLERELMWNRWSRNKSQKRPSSLPSADSKAYCYY